MGVLKVYSTFFIVVGDGVDLLTAVFLVNRHQEPTAVTQAEAFQLLLLRCFARGDL